MSDQPRVSRLTIGRLHNLGNYEHIRYEVSVEVPPGSKVGTLMAEIETLLEDLESKCPVTDYEYRDAKEILSKPIAEWKPYQFENLKCYQDRVLKHEEHGRRRQAVREKFDLLGGSTEYVDRKDKWEENQ